MSDLEQARECASEGMPQLIRRWFRDHQFDALNEIVHRWMPRMRAVARQLLSREEVAEVVYDADDAVDSALGCMLHAVVIGNYRWITEEKAFWMLFRKILARKVMMAKRHESATKRGGSGRIGHGRMVPGTEIHREAPHAMRARTEFHDDFDLYKSGLPTADVHTIAAELFERLLDVLSPDLETVARLRLGGRTIAQIAAELGLSTRTVDRRWQETHN